MRVCSWASSRAHVPQRAQETRGIPKARAHRVCVLASFNPVHNDGVIQCCKGNRQPEP